MAAMLTAVSSVNQIVVNAEYFANTNVKTYEHTHIWQVPMQLSCVKSN